MIPSIQIDPKVRPSWAALLQKWAGCTACPCHLSRTHIVHYRGYIPCDVLFIGEAPGDSEDTSGFPFVGPAGDKFEELLAQAVDSAKSYLMENFHVALTGSELPDFSIGITNIVACRPKTPKTEFASGELRIPTAEEAQACEGRLFETIRLASPKLIVTLGQIARRFYPSGKPPPKGQPTTDPAPNATVINLLHPSAILRADDRNKLRMEKRWVLDLAAVLEEL